MSLAEELLSNISAENTVVASKLSNDEEHIIVDETRTIKVPNKLKNIAVVGDKDIETATIDCIRYWDGHDLSTFAIYLNYSIANGKPQTYIPFNITTSENYFSFDWVIGREFTNVSGKLNFSITLIKLDEEGKPLYQWGSFTNSECTISQNIPNSNVIETEEDEDLLTQLVSMVQISESRLNNLLNEIMPISGTDDDTGDDDIPDDEIPDEELPDDDQPEEPKYNNVTFYLTSSVSATASYVDGDGVQRSTALSNDTTLKVGFGSYITISGSNIVSFDSTIAPSQYINSTNIIFVAPSTQTEDIVITLYENADGEYICFQAVDVTIISKLDTIVYVQYYPSDGTASRDDPLFAKEEKNISVTNPALDPSRSNIMIYAEGGANIFKSVDSTWMPSTINGSRIIVSPTSSGTIILYSTNEGQYKVEG